MMSGTGSGSGSDSDLEFEDAHDTLPASGSMGGSTSLSSLEPVFTAVPLEGEGEEGRFNSNDSDVLPPRAQTPTGSR
jgi:hypothetical protein